MPEQAPEPDAEETEDEPNQELQDPDDYHQRQRLKEIHKRRQQVHKLIDKMDFYTDEDEHNKNKTKLNMAITSYIAEIEPLIRKTEESPELPDPLPWDSVNEYATNTGSYNEDGERKTAGYQISFMVFRACNLYLEDVKPLIEEDENDEWEV